VFTGEIDDLIAMLQKWKEGGIVEVIARQEYEDVTFELKRLETDEEYQARIAYDLKVLRKKQQEEQEWEELKASQPQTFAKIRDMLRKGYT
jgi:hypothetical protein